MMMMMMMMLVAVVEAESACKWLRKQEDHTGSKSSKFQEYNNYTISMLRKLVSVTGYLHLLVLLFEGLI